MILLLKKGSWIPGQFTDNQGGHGFAPFQVSCLMLDGIKFYVRENIELPDSFAISSQQRWGMKRGILPKGSRNILDVAFECGASEGQKARIIKAIESADTLRRKARTHRGFTAAWAEAILTQTQSNNLNP